MAVAADLNRYTQEPSRCVWASEMADGGSRPVTFNVRYVGRISIETSMKMLDFHVRTALAKECIFRVCEAARFVAPQKKRQVEKKIKSLLTGQPDLRKAGENVDFTVSTKCISVVVYESQEHLFSHSMPNISFASGGDDETSEFVCYVGKEEFDGRHCFVFECGVTLATQVLAAIGEAFNARFEEFQRRALPPETHTQPSLSELSSGSRQLQTAQDSQQNTGVNQAGNPRSPALIDFNPVPTPPPRTGVSHVYVNDRAMSNGVLASPDNTSPAGSANLVLSKEIWYHGPISRQQAEHLLKNDGDFLVRKKENEEQYVLTGMQNGTARHLLLIDDKGEVRTRDKRFLSISHLIQYHRDNNLPITSTESVIILKNAVLRASR